MTSGAMTGKLRSLALLLRSPSDVWLAAKTVGWLISLPLLKRVLPLPKLVRLMWRPGDGRRRRLDRERHVADLVQRLSRASGGNCLERSLILYRFLGRANASPRLVVGLGKPDTLAGHAWITVDGESLRETPELLGTYTEFVTFADKGRKVG